MAGTKSYSQVGEDIIVHHLLGKTEGVRYVDIGCLWPVQLSNTYFFYERGGTGLCIDPNPTIAEEYRSTRPNDIFANYGVGAVSGSLDYHMYDNPVFNTFSAQRAEKLAGSSKRPIKEVRSIPVRQLSEIMLETGFDSHNIDFMSVDIEGFEMDVLPSIDWQAIRPQILVCEAIKSGKVVADNPIVKFFGEVGYSVAAFTGHDFFFRRQ